VEQEKIDLHKQENRQFIIGGQQKYILARFGDQLAEQGGYKENAGIDAVYFYLVQKHHWLPKDVKSMSTEDLVFVLSEEMSGFTMKEEDSFKHKDFHHG